MPSVSKQQQKFMGMVHALQKGDMKPSDASPEVKKAADSMSKKDAKDFASTPHKGLPKKVKQEILNKLKEYANKMGRDHLGGDDYTSSKKGGLRDFDGYDNVDYNKDMPMDESTKEDIIKDLDKAKNDLLKKVDVLIAKKKKLYSNVDIESPMSADEKKLDKDIADLFSQLNKLVLQKRKLKEGPVPQNWMQGRVSDYHTSLRGKKKDYSGGTNFRKDNTGQPDLEDDDVNEAFNELEHLKLLNLAMKAMPGSPKQKEIIKKLNQVRIAGGMKPLKEVGTNDWHFKAIKKLWDKAGTFTRKKIAGLITKNPNSNWSKIESYLKGSDYDDVTYYTDMLHLESVVNKLKSIHEGKGRDLATKLIRSARESMRRLSDNDVEEFRKEIALAFDLKESVIKEFLSPADVDSKMKELGIKKIPISSQGEKILKGMQKEGFINKVTNKERLIYFYESLGKEKFGYSTKGKPLSPLVGRYWNDITSEAIFFGGKMAAWNVVTNIKDRLANKEEVDSTYYMLKDYFNSFGIDTNNSRVFKSAQFHVDEWLKRNKNIASKIGESIKEYGQRLDLSYLEDEEARLDGTPKPKDAIDRNIDETMSRRASDIAQKLIPKDTWSRHVSFKDGGEKNKEFVKNIIRDLAQSLNRFYKSHDINVKIQENEGDFNVDMVLGVLSILRQIEDKENRQKVAVNMIKKFKEDNIDFDYKEFLNLVKEYSMGSYEYDK